MRFGLTTISHPLNRAPEMGVPRTQGVCPAGALEVSPPKGVSPIHWRLPASHDVSCPDRARWITGQLFRTIRTQGPGTGRVSMTTAPFRNPGAMTVVAGVSCLQLVQDRDGEGNRPLGDVFSPSDREALEAVSATPGGRTAKQGNPHPGGSPAFAAWVCACPGGWNCCHGKPGPVVMLRGLYRFRAMQPGHDLGGNV